MTTPDTKAIGDLKSKRSKCADVGNLDLSNVPESHETIWLQWGDNGGDDATWCANNVNDEDVPYIRADLVHSLCDELDDLQAENDRLAKVLVNLSEVEQLHREQANSQFHRANKAEAERDEARASVAEAMKHLHDIINCGNCSGSRQSARLAMGALKGGSENG